MAMDARRPHARLAGRLGAHTQHARHDARQTTARAREAFLRRFLEQVDPESLLPEAERRLRAEHARRAYFARLAMLSAQARRRRKSRSSDNDGLADGAGQPPLNEPRVR